MRRTFIAAIAVTVLALATAPAHADDIVSASVEGDCTNGSDSGLDACAEGALEGDSPDGGSYLAAHASAANGAVDVDASTVPLTDRVTGASDTLAFRGQAEGACTDDSGDDSRQDAASGALSTDGSSSGDAPDEGAAANALTYCAANGPGSGSYFAAQGSAANGAASASVDTVPVTNQFP
jgi:hypothetical protein